MILEYCENGDLRNVITELQKLSIEERINRVWILLAHIARAIDFLHSDNIIHRDIKPENIFLSQDGSVRLGDLHLAKDISQNNFYNKIQGTNIYMAVEIRLTNRMTYASDIFSFGIVLFELITGQHPFAFNTDNEQSIIDNIQKGDYQELPDWVPDEIKMIVMNMLSNNSSKRPTCKAIMEIEKHPYFTQLDSDGVIRRITEDVLANESVGINYKDLTIKLMDLLQPHGIKLPKDLQLQIIAQIHSKAIPQKIEEVSDALEALSILAENQEHHEMIVGRGGIIMPSEYIQQRIDGKQFDSRITNNSLQLLQNLFIFGTQQIQELIQTSIPTEIRIKLKLDKDNEYYKQEQQLLSAFIDAEGMKELKQIRKIIEIRDRSELISLIKAGLMIKLTDELNKTLEENDCEGKRIIIADILHRVTFDNSEAKQIIIDETNFADNYLRFLNKLPLNQMFIELLDALWELSVVQPSELKRVLFSKGIIQTLMKIVQLKDIFIRLKCGQVIQNIIIQGLIGLKIGDQNPYLKPLIDDGTAEMLIKIMKDKEQFDIHWQTARNITRLYKAQQVPQLISKDVIKQLKKDNDFEGLSLIAECPDNIEL
ncbi:MAG: putative NEK protein kinase, partial [Streblomastix strix]